MANEGIRLLGQDTQEKLLGSLRGHSWGDAFPDCLDMAIDFIAKTRYPINLQEEKKIPGDEHGFWETEHRVKEEHKVYLPFGEFTIYLARTAEIEQFLSGLPGLRKEVRGEASLDYNISIAGFRGRLGYFPHNAYEQWGKKGLNVVHSEQDLRVGQAVERFLEAKCRRDYYKGKWTQPNVDLRAS